MELIEQIREKCIAVNPEIKAFTFGLRVRSGEGFYKLINIGETDGEKWATYLGEADELIVSGDSLIIDKVLGRTIRLADVLLALKGPQDKWIKNSDKFRSHGWDVVRAWDLTKDDLTQQSEETVEFIAGIMNITS